MPDIVTSKIFVDGERGITATKMNQIISGATIQPSFVTSKPASSTLDPTDQLLEVKGAGTYATITGSQLVSSVSSQVDATPQIYSVRLRSFNAVGNPNFEVDQRNCFAAMNNSPNQTFLQDRWMIGRGGTMSVNWQGAVTGIAVPNTNFWITGRYQHALLTAQQTTLAAGDIYGIYQSIEGPQWRELWGDVTSISLLVRSSVASLKFAVSLRDSGGTVSLTKLCTCSATANTWTLITLPNIPVPTGGSWNIGAGSIGYLLNIMLACGSTYMSPANDTWQTGGNFVGAVGMDNFCGKPVNSTFDIAFVQHEPGAQCTTLMDKPFGQNYDECLRYFQKTYSYNVAPATANAGGNINLYTATSQNPIGWFPFKAVMAKVPSVTGWSSSTGAGNAVRDLYSSVDRAITGVYSNAVSDSGFSGFSIGTTNAGVTYYAFHYVADTGW